MEVKLFKKKILKFLKNFELKGRQQIVSNTLDTMVVSCHAKYATNLKFLSKFLVFATYLRIDDE